MSHVTTIKVEIKDLESLKEACKLIGLEFRENQKTYRWYGHSMGDYPMPQGFNERDLGKCNHAIVIPNNKNAYEIGVVERDGKYIMLWDFWNSGYGLEKVAGKDCCNLTDAYTQNITRKEVTQFANENGYTMIEEFDTEANEVVLKLRRY